MKNYVSYSLYSFLSIILFHYNDNKSSIIFRLLKIEWFLNYVSHYRLGKYIRRDITLGTFGRPTLSLFRIIILKIAEMTSTVFEVDEVLYFNPARALAAIKI